MLTRTQVIGNYSYPYLGQSLKGKPWGTVPETPLHQISDDLAGELSFSSPGFLSLQSMLRRLTLAYGLFADRGQLLRMFLGRRWE